MKKLLIPFFVFIICGCVSDYDGKLPDSEPIPVLNGVLCADSVLSLSLTWSNHPRENAFLPIENAGIQLTKNGAPVTSDYSFAADGTCTFDDICTNDDKFEIEVNIPGYPPVTSQTVIPAKPDISLIYTDRAKDGMYSKNFGLEISNIDENTHAVYIFLFLRLIRSFPEHNYYSDSGWRQEIFLFCDSPFTDSFNKNYDSWAPKGFSDYYDNFIRIPVDNLVGNRLEAKLAFFDQGEHARYYILAVSKEYDLYFKGGHLQRSFDPEQMLPFTYEPVFLPSNVEGGAGIFAGIDISMFEFLNENED